MNTLNILPGEVGGGIGGDEWRGGGGGVYRYHYLAPNGCARTRCQMWCHQTVSKMRECMGVGVMATREADESATADNGQITVCAYNYVSIPTFHEVNELEIVRESIKKERQEAAAAVDGDSSMSRIRRRLIIDDDGTIDIDTSTTRLSQVFDNRHLERTNTRTSLFATQTFTPRHAHKSSILRVVRSHP